LRHHRADARGTGGQGCAFPPEPGRWQARECPLVAWSSAMISPPSGPRDARGRTRPLVVLTFATADVSRRPTGGQPAAATRAPGKLSRVKCTALLDRAPARAQPKPSASAIFRPCRVLPPPLGSPDLAATSGHQGVAGAWLRLAFCCAARHGPKCRRAIHVEGPSGRPSSRPLWPDIGRAWRRGAVRRSLFRFCPGARARCGAAAPNSH
jgi:hypothetical protein